MTTQCDPNNKGSLRHLAHSRTRSDHVRETAEDYVEAIYELEDQRGECRVVDLTEHFGVSHVTAIKILRRLSSEKLVITRPYSPVTLTRKGRTLAKKCQKRHQMVEAFLCKLGVSARVAALDAEGIEHHVSPETLRCIESFLSA